MTVRRRLAWYGLIADLTVQARDFGSRHRLGLAVSQTGDRVGCKQDS